MDLGRASGAARRRWPVAGLALFLGGLVLFGVLAEASRRFSNETEQRLLNQQTQQAGVVLTLAIDQYRAPLTAAARAAAATDGSTDVFTQFVTPLVDGSTYVRVALMRVGDTEPLVVVGDGPLVVDEAGRAALVADDTDPFRIVDLLASGRVLGYVAREPSAPWVVYAERQLSADPNQRLRTDEPFNELNYAFYLDADETPDQLLSSSTAELPLRGRRATVDIPFGDHQLRIVTTARGRLGSNELQALWWVVLGGGVAASAGVAWLLERVLAGRRRAQQLATLTERLYTEQRDTAESLQRSLLPALASVPAGLEVAGRYWPAGTAHLIGGDFYDVFQIDANRWGVLIGDVCGKGIEAASLTGLARYTVQGAARFCTSPSEMLRAIHVALRQQDTATFCTACLIVVEPAASGGGRATICLGGHPAPLMRRADGTMSEIGTAGSILGWFEPRLHDVAIEFGVGDVVVLYTDGLTDAPGEQAVPIAEVIDMVGSEGGTVPVGQLADDIRTLKRRRRPHGSTDDTAVLCLRFKAPSPGA